MWSFKAVLGFAARAKGRVVVFVSWLGLVREMVVSRRPSSRTGTYYWELSFQEEAGVGYRHHYRYAASALFLVFGCCINEDIYSRNRHFCARGELRIWRNALFVLESQQPWTLSFRRWHTMDDFNQNRISSCALHRMFRID